MVYRTVCLLKEVLAGLPDSHCSIVIHIEYAVKSWVLLEPHGL